MWTSWYQLKAILWKNWLQKKAHMIGFMAELFLPVAFMGLLILIKTITTVYDSPNVAYYCGNAYPWFYSSTAISNANDLPQSIPYVCTMKPDTCSLGNYYNDASTFSTDGTNSFTVYDKYGYIDTTLSAGITNNPFYTFTIGDKSTVYGSSYNSLLANPSYPLCTILRRINRNNAILAITPDSDEGDNVNMLYSQASYLRNYMLSACAREGNYSSSIVLFSSQSSVESYITNEHYDDIGYGQGKVAFAIVWNNVDIPTAQWDYSIRVNFTSVFDQDDPTVACLYGGHSCNFRYSIPTTKFKTLDLLKPQLSSYLYGYTFTGFATLQLTVDQYIFSYYPPTYKQANIQRSQQRRLTDEINIAAMTTETLQNAQEYSFTAGLHVVDIMASIGLMPTASFKSDDFQYIIASTLGIFYMLSYLYPVSRIIRALVIEKEFRIKEGMKMMGLTDTVYNLSWFVTVFTQLTIVSILITLITANSIFEYSNKIYVFFYFEFFGLAIMGMCFLLASIFSKSKTASLLGPMIFFATFFPYYAVSDAQYDASSKVAACLLAPACFALGANVFADYEGGLVGIQSSNVDQETSNFTYNLTIGMLFVDAILYSVLAWYIDKVLPSEYGTALPYYFPLLPSYWCNMKCCDANERQYEGNNHPITMWWLWITGQSRPYRKISRHEAEQAGLEGGIDSSNPLATTLLTPNPMLSPVGTANASTTRHGHSQSQGHGHSKKPQYYEGIATEFQQQIHDQQCISIRNLTKTFPNLISGQPDHIAVNDLSFDLFQNQITVLLGHNGAGKTTTINMLIGMIPPTSGTAYMPNGFSITEDMAKIRQKLGVCPQHDILFPELTVLQHLQIFAAFKGVSSSNVLNEANNIIKEIGLKEKSNMKSSTLSGGQKRKLSLGIALIGDSKVVILDEPTSGMDPFSRRSTWNIIQRNKKNRVILLTTHFMDEADLLGDRIAIMAYGQLQCMGSSMFLKKQFGVGYLLTVAKQISSHVLGNTGGETATEEYDRISIAIDHIIKSFIPTAELVNNVGAEQSYRLLFSSSSQFVALFEALDAQKESLSIAEYGISVTTLEEVFIRVGDMVEEEEHQGTTNIRRSVDRASLSSIGGASGLSIKDLNESAEAHQKREVKMQSLEKDSSPIKTVATSPVVDDASSPLVSKPTTSVGLTYPSPSFFQHFQTTITKRAIYAKRDTRMIICQFFLPVIVVVIGLGLLLLQPDFNQPDLVLTPDPYNAAFDVLQRNFVPFSVPSDSSSSLSQANVQYMSRYDTTANHCPVCDQIRSRFNGDNTNGVYGVAIPVTPDKMPVEDPFGGCSVGGDALFNMSKYLIQTPEADLNEMSGSSVYGSVTLGTGTNYTNLNYNILVNGSAIHGVGVYMNLIHQAYLQALNTIDTSTIKAHNHPLPQTYKQENESATMDAFVVSLFMMIACCFIPASFVVFVVKEKEIKAKHQQIISGLNVYAYWCALWCWDIIAYFPTVGLILAVIYAFDIDAFVTGDSAVGLIVVFLLYGPAIAAMTYLMSFFFQSHSTAQVFVMFYNFVTGLCLMVVSFVLTTIPKTTSISLQLRYLFRLFPSFCLGDSIGQLALCTGGNQCPSINSDGYDFTTLQSPWSWDILGGNITFLAVEIVVYFTLVLLFEFGLTFPKLLSWLYLVQDPGIDTTELEGDDEDVKAERQRIASGQGDRDVIRLVELRKVYPMNSSFGGIDLWNILKHLLYYCCTCGMGNMNTTNKNEKSKQQIKVAVQSLSFGIPNGECFGFLGINGAGKTTTLSILSGEYPPTSGTAFIDSENITYNQNSIRKKIGYCPQFDALLDLLTVREHLELYGRIKGIFGEALEEVVISKMTQFNLLQFENKLSGSLSGGNKRKLSVAIATMGNPPIIFLDEPSTGMDPVARRFMWKVIAEMSTQNAHCSVILTTHSMEEAEALCTRIGVMVNGKLRCLGSTQHLKHRHGNGFEVNFKFRQPTDEQLVSTWNISAGDGGRSGRGRTPSTSQTNPDALWVSGRYKPDDLDHTKFTLADITSIAHSLQHPECLPLIAPCQSGATIHESLQSEGHVSARIFLDWWLTERYFVRLEQYLQETFPPMERILLLERNNALTCRYRIQLDISGTKDENAHTNALSDIFAKLEQAKESLSIQEYSVGQTTLEQIFNHFAGMQDNPEVAMLNNNTTDTAVTTAVTTMTSK